MGIAFRSTVKETDMHKLLLIALALLISALPAQARKKQHHARHHVSHHYAKAAPTAVIFDLAARPSYPTEQTRQPPSYPMGRGHIAPSRGYDMAEGNDPRPGAWCMWWLRRHLGIAKSAFPNGGYNIARNGRYIGSPASGPAVGVMVVWNHHVGVITGGSPGHWVVLSGNDGHAVRERERPLNRVIAYRWPNSSTTFSASRHHSSS